MNGRKLIRLELQNPGEYEDVLQDDPASYGIFGGGKESEAGPGLPVLQMAPTDLPSPGRPRDRVHRLRVDRPQLFTDVWRGPAGPFKRAASRVVLSTSNDTPCESEQFRVPVARYQFIFERVDGLGDGNGGLVGRDLPRLSPCHIAAVQIFDVYCSR